MKARRLSFRQAVQCEMGRGGTPSRCRCGGSCAGLRRCDPVKPTRWCFTKLPASDPHHIPAQRRRISPRTAVHVLTDAAKRLEWSGSHAAAKTLRECLVLVNRVVRDERVKLEAQREARAMFSRDLV